MAVVVVLSLALLASCGGRSSSPPRAANATPVESIPDDELDCPWVAEGCGEEDGCSDHEGHAREGLPASTVASVRGPCGATVPSQLLADVAGQLHKADLTRVRILASTTACGDAVRDALSQATGAAPTRFTIEVVTQSRYVHFEVAAFRGVACASPPR